MCLMKQIPDWGTFHSAGKQASMLALNCPHSSSKCSNLGISSAWRVAGPPVQSFQPLVSRGAELLLEILEEPLGLSVCICLEL